MRDHWEYHNRDIYELLDFSDVDSLEMICHHYKLDATFKEKNALKGKIEKANLLVLDKKPSEAVDGSNDSLKRKTKVSLMVDDNKFNSKTSQTKPKVDVSKSKYKKPKIKLKENSQPQEVHFQIGTITHSKNGKIGIGLTVVGIVISIIALFNVWNNPRLLEPARRPATWSR